MIKNIIFDIGNVLADFTWESFLRNQGYDDAMVDKIAAASVHTKDWREYDRGILTSQEVVNLFVENDPSIKDVLIKAFSCLTGMVSRNDYAISWIEELKSKGLKIYYLSNFSEQARYECSEALDFIQYTDGGVFSFDSHLIKPDYEIYRYLLSKYGLQPEESIFIDDTEINIIAASELGFNTVHFKNLKEAQENILELIEKQQ